MAPWLSFQKAAGFSANLPEKRGPGEAGGLLLRLRPHFDI